jgi:hypothetical protein
MSAGCSLDEPGKPSFGEHPSRLPPRQIARASSGARQPPRSQQCRREPATPDTANPAAPTQLQRPRVPAAAPRTRGPEGCSAGRRARLPHQKACTGGSRLWFPILRLAFQKLSPSCGNFGGRNWVRTSDPSLVRRNTAPITPSSARWFMRLNCENNARRCPEVPGRVCTVVPASGSRSSLLTPRLKSELGWACPACRTSIIRSLQPEGCPIATIDDIIAVRRW